MLALVSLSSAAPVPISSNTSTLIVTATTLAEGCSCAGGSIDVFSNERIPHAQTGAGCIGGCGGDKYELHSSGSMVKGLHFFGGGDHGGFKGIQATFFDGTVKSSGNVVSGTPCSCEIAPGDYLTGDLILSGNGIGTRLGYYYHQTLSGSTCECGDSGHDHYIFPTEDSFLGGFFGQASSELDQLGVFLWKPVASVTLASIAYPTLDTLSKIKSPKEIVKHTYCNDNSESREFETFSDKKTVTDGHDSCFSAGTSFQFGEKLIVESDIPLLGKVKDETSWQMTTTESFKNCIQHSNTDEQTLTFPTVTLKPHSRTSYVYSQYQGALEQLPYTAKVIVTFKDGTTWQETQSGVYKGTSYLSLDSYFTDEETGVTHCT